MKEIFSGSNVLLGLMLFRFDSIGLLLTGQKQYMFLDLENLHTGVRSIKSFPFYVLKLLKFKCIQYFITHNFLRLNTCTQRFDRITIKFKTSSLYHIGATSNPLF